MKIAPSIEPLGKMQISNTLETFQSLVISNYNSRFARWNIDFSTVLCFTTERSTSGFDPYRISSASNWRDQAILTDSTWTNLENGAAEILGCFPKGQGMALSEDEEAYRRNLEELYQLRHTVATRQAKNPEDDSADSTTRVYLEDLAHYFYKEAIIASGKKYLAIFLFYTLLALPNMVQRTHIEDRFPKFDKGASEVYRCFPYLLALLDRVWDGLHIPLLLCLGKTFNRFPYILELTYHSEKSS